MILILKVYLHFTDKNNMSLTILDWTNKYVICQSYISLINIWLTMLDLTDNFYWQFNIKFTHKYLQLTILDSTDKL